MHIINSSNPSVSFFKIQEIQSAITYTFANFGIDVARY
jgi:hypothetical protein